MTDDNDPSLPTPHASAKVLGTNGIAAFIGAATILYAQRAIPQDSPYQAVVVYVSPVTTLVVRYIAGVAGTCGMALLKYVASRIFVGRSRREIDEALKNPGLSVATRKKFEKERERLDAVAIEGNNAILDLVFARKKRR